MGIVLHTQNEYKKLRKGKNGTILLSFPIRHWTWDLPLKAPASPIQWPAVTQTLQANHSEYSEKIDLLLPAAK